MKNSTKKPVLCIIPARFHSSRLPGKPLKLIKGLPLIMWTYNNAEAAAVFDSVLVATDDQRIYAAVEENGGKAIMTSDDHQSGTDRVLEALEVITNDDVFIVNLQGDEPRIPATILQDFVRNLSRIDKLSLLTCVSDAKIEEINNPNVVKVVLDSKDKALYFSRAAIPFARDATPYKCYKHSGIYGFTKKSLELFCGFPPGKLEQVEKLEQLRALENGMKIHCLVKNFSSLNIDTQQDLEQFRGYADTL